MKPAFTLFLVFIFTPVVAQFAEMPFETTTLAELQMKVWPADSGAEAVVLNELGQARIDIDEHQLIFNYYIKIKILTKNGLKRGNFEIDLYKSDDGRIETISDIKAVTYSLQNSSRKITAMDSKKVYTETDSRGSKTVKFALPDVREGSVVEVRYKISSPFYFNFRTWEYQSDIPKKYSEYAMLIPGNYQYAISIRGPFKLTRNESVIVPNCYTAGNASVAECAYSIYGIENIPAFKEEDFMTAEKNFLSAVYFELIQIQDFDGIIKKFTKEWKDVDHELLGEDQFGKQIKKARGLLEDPVKLIVGAETDPLTQAKKIYNYIKFYYTWSGRYGCYTDLGVKKAREEKKGSVGDINLSLVGALQSAGLDTDPLILSTRANGLVTDLYPVLSEYNYVIACLTIGGQQYLLDATDDFLPFGVLPARCLNDRGRKITKESAFVPIKFTEKYKRNVGLELTMQENGQFTGKITFRQSGYSALDKRHEISSAGSQDEYLKELKKEWDHITISNYKIENLSELDKPLIETMDVVIDGDEVGKANTVYLSPFMFERITKNPFTTSERLYPVDYGAPTESGFFTTISYPASFKIEEFPKPVALALPVNGGKYVFSVSSLGGKVTIVSNLTIAKAVYSPPEYHFLKELYAQIIQSQQSQIVFKR